MHALGVFMVSPWHRHPTAIPSLSQSYPSPIPVYNVYPSIIFRSSSLTVRLFLMEMG